MGIFRRSRLDPASSPTGSRRRLRLARLSVSVAFFCFAFVNGSWAPRIPAIKDATHVDDTYLGIALAGLAVGALVGTRLANLPIERFGSARCTRLSLLALCVTVIGPGVVSGFGGLLATLTLLGFAIGVLDVAVNAQAVQVERAYRRPLMSGMHGLYSVGMLAGAAAAGLVAQFGVSPSAHFPVVATGMTVTGLIALRWLLAERVADREALRAGHDEPSGPRPMPATRSLWSPAVLLLGLIGFSAFVGEGAANDWSAVYLRDSLRTGEGVAASGVTVFSLAMAVVRLVADRLLGRFGPVTVVRVGAIVAAVGFAAGLFLHHPVAAVAGFGLLGAGLAPIVPAVVSAAGNLGDTSSATLGRVVMLGYLGSTTGPILIGLLAGLFGLPVALGLLIVLAALIAVLANRLSTRGSPPSDISAQPTHLVPASTDNRA